jgi:peptide/nickel transport system permease protein
VLGPFARFLIRRILHALLLVFAAASLALLLVHLAGSGTFDDFGQDPTDVVRRRAQFGFDRPFLEQYAAWMRGALTLDFGQSVRFGRPVAALLGERIGPTVLLGTVAFALALAIGLPAGVYTGSAPSRGGARVIRAASVLLISTPPLVTALLLVFVAVRTGILPSGGLATGDGGILGWTAGAARYLPLPALALALPIAASLERVQSRALQSSLGERSIIAARARGVPALRTVWVHAWRLSLPPVLGLLGIIFGSVLSGSLIVEVVLSWPGLGGLMHQALIARDLHLAAACAAAGALFLSAGLTLAELALFVADPRTQEPA